MGLFLSFHLAAISVLIYLFCDHGYRLSKLSFSSLSTDKSVQALKDDVRLGFDTPGTVLKKWMSEVDSSWKGQKEIVANICLATIVKVTYAFAVQHLPHTSPFNEDSARVLKIFRRTESKDGKLTSKVQPDSCVRDFTSQTKKMVLKFIKRSLSQAKSRFWITTKRLRS